MTGKDLCQVDVRVAEVSLPKLVGYVEAGGEIMISHAGKPTVRMVPVPMHIRQSKLDGWEGRICLDPDLEETGIEHEEMFYGPVRNWETPG